MVAVAFVLPESGDLGSVTTEKIAPSEIIIKSDQCVGIGSEPDGKGGCRPVQPNMKLDINTDEKDAAIAESFGCEYRGNGAMFCGRRIRGDEVHEAVRYRQEPDQKCEWVGNFVYGDESQEIEIGLCEDKVVRWRKKK